MLLADRFYPSAELFEWLQRRGCQYRLRLKGNLSVDVGRVRVWRTEEVRTDRFNRALVGGSPQHDLQQVIGGADITFGLQGQMTR
jgi:hypothetical protein